MMRSEAVTQIRSGLGFNSRLDEGHIVNSLISAQRMLEQVPELPWFLQVFNEPLEASEELVSLPDGFIREVESGALWLVLENRKFEILKSPFEATGEALSTGKPAYYRLEVDVLRLMPAPDKTYSMRFNYYKKDQELGSDTENRWLKHAPDVLIGFAGQLLCGQTKDDKSYQTFSELRARGEQMLHMENVARRETGVKYQMGGPH